MLAEAVAAVLLITAAAAAVGTGRGDRRAAAALTATVAVPSLAQFGWPALLAALRGDPAQVLHHGQWWRLVTAVAVQDGGVAGTAFNLATLAVVAALGVRWWGGVRAAAVFWIAGLALNLLATAGNVATAGSSGATFVLAASVAGAAVLRCRGGTRYRAAAAPAAGALLLALGDFHGLAVLVAACSG